MLVVCAIYIYAFLLPLRYITAMRALLYFVRHAPFSRAPVVLLRAFAICFRYFFFLRGCSAILRRQVRDAVFRALSSSVVRRRRRRILARL